MVLINDTLVRLAWNSSDITMWQFLPNFKPPPKKKSAEGKKEANRRYEKELRERNFQESWKMGQEWFEYTESEECRIGDGENIFLVIVVIFFHCVLCFPLKIHEKECFI